MIYLSDIEDVLRIPASDVLAGCAYIVIDWRRTSSRLNDIGHGPAVYLHGNYWVPYGMEEYLRNLMFERSWGVLEIVGAIYRMYDEYGNQLGSAVDLNGRDFDVLYVERPLHVAGNPSADDLVEQRLLNSGKVGWVTPAMSFAFLVEGVWGIDGNYVTYTYRDGSTEQVVASSQLTYDPDVVSAHVQFRNRSMDIFYLNQNAHVFQFRNFFNREEDISIPGAIIDSPSTALQTGVLGSSLVKYDITHDREYTLKSALLPAYMYHPILAMCRSKIVRLGRWGKQIIITSFKLPRSTAPNTPVTFEMKYKFVDSTSVDAITLS